MCEVIDALKTERILAAPAFVLAGNHTTEAGGKTKPKARPKGCLSCARPAAAGFGASGPVLGGAAPVIYEEVSRLLWELSDDKFIWDSEAH
jgi:hypothetical protein